MRFDKLAIFHFCFTIFLLITIILRSHSIRNTHKCSVVHAVASLAYDFISSFHWFENKNALKSLIRIWTFACGGLDSMNSFFKATTINELEPLKWLWRSREISAKWNALCLELKREHLNESDRAHSLSGLKKSEYMDSISRFAWITNQYAN